MARRAASIRLVTSSPVMSASSSSSKRTTCCDRASTRVFVVVRLPMVTTERASEPMSRSMVLITWPSASSPTAQTRSHSAPMAATFCATFAAPPRASSLSRMRTTGTGRSGDMLSTSPRRYTSSIASPTMAIRLLAPASSSSISRSREMVSIMVGWTVEDYGSNDSDSLAARTPPWKENLSPKKSENKGACPLPNRDLRGYAPHSLSRASFDSRKIQRRGEARGLFPPGILRSGGQGNRLHLRQAFLCHRSVPADGCHRRRLYRHRAAHRIFHRHGARAAVGRAARDVRRYRLYRTPHRGLNGAGARTRPRRTYGRWTRRLRHCGAARIDARNRTDRCPQHSGHRSDQEAGDATCAGVADHGSRPHRHQ